MLDYVIIVLLLAVIILLIVMIAGKKENGADVEDKLEDGFKYMNDSMNREMDKLNNTVRILGDSFLKNQDVMNDALYEKINLLDKNISEKQSEQKQTISEKIELLDKNIYSKQNEQNKAVSEKIELLDKNISDKQELSRKTIEQGISAQEERFKSFSADNARQLEEIRASVDRRLNAIQEDNNKKLDDMRKIVDEKLQETIDKKMSQSFEIVSNRLEQVYKGLGEMQKLAVSVGDLKNTLSNVKSRGILGEIQLGAILKDILSPEQYSQNVKVRKDSDNIVEFAVNLPADDTGFIYLPIDSKFPLDTYNSLLQAYEAGSKPAADAAKKDLKNRIKKEAKDISDKYIYPPETTDFGIMFLPTEGLYAEVVNMGLIEELQREYRVNVAGPSTMAALLNSLQMGFRTLAIQKRSSEVWEVLGAVRTEFDKFADVLAATQKKLNLANNELDDLIGRRTRAIQKRLKNVARLEESEAAEMLADEYTTEDV